MKLAICAGPATTGKTAVLRHIISKLRDRGARPAFLKIDVQFAEGYEGMVAQTRVELKIGMRYFFQPRMCMLQWRHSGLVNFMNRTSSGTQVRLEGLWIG